MIAYACAECGRGCFTLTPDGLCARCDALLAAQIRLGLDQLADYLGKVAAFQAWETDYRRMSA